MLLEERLRVCPEVNYLWPESLNVFAVGHKFLLILLPTCVYNIVVHFPECCVYGVYIYPTIKLNRHTMDILPVKGIYSNESNLAYRIK